MADFANSLTSFLVKKGVSPAAAGSAANLVMKRGLMKQPYTANELKLLTVFLDTPEAMSLKNGAEAKKYGVELTNATVSDLRTEQLNNGAAAPAAFGTEPRQTGYRPRPVIVTSYSTAGSPSDDAVRDIVNAISSNQPLRTAEAKSIAPQG
ncbi:hypothetical protein AB3Y40_03685 [Yoonia sp. R2331]|uniref:hypothetical protein n=1 Tax=Yoonia sp. R2331 TaxID=3237238 RepID=UPI0034E4E00A